jgi:hypothetical protein
MKSLGSLAKMIITMLSKYDSSLEKFFNSLDRDDMHELMENLQDIIYDWTEGYDNTEE